MKPKVSNCLSAMQRIPEGELTHMLRSPGPKFALYTSNMDRACVAKIVVASVPEKYTTCVSFVLPGFERLTKSVNGEKREYLEDATLFDDN